MSIWCSCVECVGELYEPSDEEIAAAEAYKIPPCVECGAMTELEAETKCICSGDKDNCHGCDLWPD